MPMMVAPEQQESLNALRDMLGYRGRDMEAVSDDALLDVLDRTEWKVQSAVYEFLGLRNGLLKVQEVCPLTEDEFPPLGGKPTEKEPSDRDEWVKVEPSDLQEGQPARPSSYLAAAASTRKS